MLVTFLPEMSSNVTVGSCGFSPDIGFRGSKCDWTARWVRLFGHVHVDTKKTEKVGFIHYYTKIHCVFFLLVQHNVKFTVWTFTAFVQLQLNDFFIKVSISFN